MVIANGDKWEIYKQRTTEWIITEPVEKDAFIRSGLLRFVVQQANLYSIIGFMNEFKGDVEFKVKDMTQARNNRGSKCDNEIKADVMKRLTIVLGEEMYTQANTDNLEKAALCVILEMLCRYFNESGRNGKVWFLDVEMSLINKIGALKIK
jgi:hypothetical protein